MKARFLTANPGWKLFSLVLAIAIWITVASEPELSTFVSVPVQYKDVPKDMEISSEAPDKVSLELRGPSGELGRFSNTPPAVILDMSTVHRPGERTFPLTNGSVTLPRSIHLVRAIPSQLRFDFEHSMTKTVPVQVRFAGAPQDGYQVSGYSVVPDKIIIVGPESRVARIRNVATDSVDLQSIVSQAEFHVNAFVQDPRVRLQSNPMITIKVTVKRAT